MLCKIIWFRKHQKNCHFLSEARDRAKDENNAFPFHGHSCRSKRDQNIAQQTSISLHEIRSCALGSLLNGLSKYRRAGVHSCVRKVRRKKNKKKTWVFAKHHCKPVFPPTTNTRNPGHRKRLVSQLSSDAFASFDVFVVAARMLAFFFWPFLFADPEPSEQGKRCLQPVNHSVLHWKEGLSLVMNVITGTLVLFLFFARWANSSCQKVTKQNQRHD